MGHFTPGHAALGGLLLGVAACAQLLLNGRVLGISGAIKGLFLPPTPGAAAGCDAAGGRAEFVVGMLSASALLGVVAPAAFLPLPHASYSVSRRSTSFTPLGRTQRHQPIFLVSASASSKFTHITSFCLLHQQPCCHCCLLILYGHLTAWGTE